MPFGLMVECLLFWKLTPDGNLAGAQDRARVLAALNVPPLDMIHLPPVAQLKCQPAAERSFILVSFLWLRRFVEIESRNGFADGPTSIQISGCSR
jgi:hypothetical protein